MIVKLRKDKNTQNFENNRKFPQNLDKIQIIKIFPTISLSQETIQYPYFKLERFSLAHNEP